MGKRGIGKIEKRKGKKEGEKVVEREKEKEKKDYFFHLIFLKR